MKFVGTLGKYRGNLDGLVYSTAQGTDYIKRKAENVNQPNTEAQRNTVARFSFFGSFSRKLGAFLKIGMKGIKGKLTIHNVFQKINQAAVATADGVASFVPAQLKISQGNLTGIENISGQASSGGELLSVSGSAAADNLDSFATDKLHVCVLDGAGNVVASAIDVDTRANIGGSIDVDIPPVAEGETLHVYTFASSANYSRVSDSQYMAVLVGA